MSEKVAEYIKWLEEKVESEGHYMNGFNDCLDQAKEKFLSLFTPEWQDVKLPSDINKQDEAGNAFCVKHYPEIEDDLTKEVEVFDAGAYWYEQELKRLNPSLFPSTTKTDKT